MMVEILLLALLTLLTGVHSLRTQLIYVKAGEMVALHCPQYKEGHAQLIWTRHTSQEKNVTDSMSTSADQSHTGVLINRQSLVILRASVDHQGNYSCSLGNTSRKTRFRLTVYTTQSRENEGRGKYPATCYTQQPCTLYCPDVNVPWVISSNISSNGITWHKEGKTSPTESHFTSVEEKDGGVYICTRSYLYNGQLYNMTFTVILNVKQIKQTGQSVILSPSHNDVFPVDLGSTVVIECKAVLYSRFDDVFWLSGTSFIKTNNKLPVFYNYSRIENDDKIEMTAFLVFKNMSKDDLSKNFTCKLESDHQLSTFIAITLTQKSMSDISWIYEALDWYYIFYVYYFPTAHPISPSLSLYIVGIMVVVIIITAVGYMKFKIHIALFLRDTLGCYGSISDEKSYDAYLMYYKSDTDEGLSEDDRKCLENVLEGRFGYRLYHHHGDVLTKKAVTEAVLNYAEKSRTVVVVPSTSDSGPGSDQLNNILKALVESQTHLVFIKPDSIQVSGSESDALQCFSETGASVIWKGRSSLLPTSSFWKLLRYNLPAPQHTQKPLPDTKMSEEAVTMFSREQTEI
ncbi:interleukin-1 receptor type 1-like [Leuresthes tenuis]|uniref:interleukin-1 receptor type 1-like n=1 Tax=Leuresthes tenuis TaxID=355514 RepID=UPI003B507C75